MRVNRPAVLPLPIATLLWTGLLACLTATVAYATANYAYKRGEYPTIHQGMAPNRQFSVTSHGDGDDGYDNFHLYLMAEPGHKKIGPLEEVKDVLDTAPSAYSADWRRDSRYVVLYYRADRHLGGMNFYRIQNRRAYPVTGPDLLQTVLRRAAPATKQGIPYRLNGSIGLNWISPTRFKLAQDASFREDTSTLGTNLGKFGKSEREDANDGSSPTYYISFSAEAICELTSGDHYRIVSMKPGKFDD